MKKKILYSFISILSISFFSSAEKICAGYSGKPGCIQSKAPVQKKQNMQQEKDIRGFDLSPLNYLVFTI